MKLTKAQKQSQLRIDKEGRGECRSCPNPVVKNPKTGRPRKSCQSCLDADAERNRK